jgi:hypothetical protein
MSLARNAKVADWSAIPMPMSRKNAKHAVDQE